MTDSSRRHDRDNFYKYMHAETARKVLLSGRLRWSSPLLFNDPFDVPRDIAHGFASSDISRAVGELLNHYLDEPPEDLSDFDDQLAKLIALSKNGLPNELREEIRGTISEAVELEGNGKALQALRDHWATLVPTMRILCLTESPKHVAMWHHYADCYRGVVLGFKCNDESDNFLLVAEPIRYLASKPDVYTDHGLARLICLNGIAAARETTNLATYTKSDDWSYEKEWRIVSYADPGDPDQYSDWPFGREDLSHVYLGPLIDDEARDQILEIVNGYPFARVFRTSIGMDRELHFHELSAN